MSVNNFLPFCNTDTGSNLDTQSEYAAASDRVTGNTGIARKKLVNKGMRQASAIMSQFADITMDRLGADVLDDGNLATLKAQLALAFPNTISALSPTFFKATSGSGTYFKPYRFVVTAANATVGATYTNNSQTFTVRDTIAGGTILVMTATGNPTSSGTLTKATGTGDSTITFSSYKNPVALKCMLLGAGAGGGGGGTSGAGTGGAGGDTTFGTSLLSAGGGSSSTGGTASLGTGPVGIAVHGGDGSGGSSNVSFPGGGFGAPSALSGGGSGIFNGAGIAAYANSGAGGGGGGGNGTASNNGGFGGGAGAFIQAIITNILASYAWAVGAAGSAGSAGSNGSVGGAGGSGLLSIEEIY